MREARKSQLPITENWLDLEHAKELEAISRLLDAHPRITELVLQDLYRVPASGARGARGMTAEQVLRALLVKQINSFSYRELAFHLADSRSYRTFCRLGITDRNPSKSTLAANIKALTPATLEEIHRIIIGAAQEAGIDDGKKMRIDCTVVEANIHHPTDSELLWDCARVLTRLLRRARKALGAERIQFNDRTRRAKRRRKEINTARRQAKRVEPYRDLIRVVAEILAAATSALERFPSTTDSTDLQRVRRQLETYVTRTRKVIDQARSRVLDGHNVPASEKIVSIFEEHADIIRKDARDTFYGHKVCLTAGRSCIVFDLLLLEGNPPDSTLPLTMVERCRDITGQVPRQAAFDGGFSSIANLEAVKAAGVKDAVFAKGRGLAISDMAKSTWVYKRLRNFRAGIEGIISFLKRAFGLRRCTWRSLESFHSYAWSSIIASNLLIVARHLL